MRISVSDYIVIDSRFCHGKPIFKGTRIMVSQVLELLEAGRSAKDILKAFPSLSPQAGCFGLFCKPCKGGDTAIFLIAFKE
jgi:uncharacterized protein (DUF433 family)